MVTQLAQPYTGYPYQVDLSTTAKRLAHLRRRRAELAAGVTHPVDPRCRAILGNWVAAQIRREREQG